MYYTLLYFIGLALMSCALGDRVEASFGVFVFGAGTMMAGIYTGILRYLLR